MSRPVAEHEVQRILALVPWLDAHPGAPVSDVARRFGVSDEQVREDLDLVLMIGVPPYTPDAYIDVEVDDDDRVTVRLGDLFRRPLSLTPAEGLALLAAGEALLAVPGSDSEGPLARALDKLRAVLDAPDLRVEVATPEHLGTIQRAAQSGQRLEIDYWSAGRDERTVRKIDPNFVFFALGHWYVSAFCHRVGAERMFRADRMRGVTPTAERFEPADPIDPMGAPLFTPSPHDERVTLNVPATAAWIAEAHPAESIDDVNGGRLRVVLAVSSGAWLERLLLRLGPEVDIEAPAHWRERRRQAATAVLNRYRRRDADSQASREDLT